MPQGHPVVIADNGKGFPVNPVTERAPLLTVAENGKGAPIVISELGAPFIIQGYEGEVMGLALSGDDGSNITDDDGNPVETF